ncbi:hypothetical protein [Amaricoccus macauensis]|uniref:hypothetical protein n=1 Tax=Amaricoccus macauensis TaxID=57001 RepID=UPI003C7AFB66
MSNPNNFFQNAVMRSVMLNLFTVATRSMFWRKGPRVFVNSIPKAGTHLLTSILEEVPGIMLSRAHIDVNDVAGSNWQAHSPMSQFELDVSKLVRFLRTIRGGQVASGHLPWVPEIIETLNELNFVTIFMSRNCDDILNSRYHYISGLRRHHLHSRLMEDYSNEAARRQALVDGIPWRQDKPGTEPAAVYFAAYERWETNSGALQVRFEDLVGAHGGGSDIRRKEALAQILNAIGVPHDAVAVERLHQMSLNKKSFTLRSGRIGEGATQRGASHVE